MISVRHDVLNVRASVSAFVAHSLQTGVWFLAEIDVDSGAIGRERFAERERTPFDYLIEKNGDRDARNPR